MSRGAQLKIPINKYCESSHCDQRPRKPHSTNWSGCGVPHMSQGRNLQAP